MSPHRPLPCHLFPLSQPDFQTRDFARFTNTSSSRFSFVFQKLPQMKIRFTLQHHFISSDFVSQFPLAELTTVMLDGLDFWLHRETQPLCNAYVHICILGMILPSVPLVNNWAESSAWPSSSCLLKQKFNLQGRSSASETPVKQLSCLLQYQPPLHLGQILTEKYFRTVSQQDLCFYIT